MLKLSNAFLNRSVLSLRTGGKIGVAIEPIINPNNLKIEAWSAKDTREKGDFVLPTGEVREFISKGLVVNDHDALTRPEDMVRLTPVMNINFILLGKSVVTEDNRKIGKISDYSVDDGYYVKKMYVTPPLLKSFSTEQLIIDRDSVVEVTDKKIVIKESREKLRSPVSVAAEA